MSPNFSVRRLGYASGNFSKNILASSVDVLLLFVMTDMLRINPALAGLIMLSSLVLDALLDPLVGLATDRMRGPLGRYGPFILLGAPISAGMFIALFQLPALGLHSALLVALLSWGFRLGYSLIDLPHNALMTAVAPAGPERARLATYRFLFSSLASLIIAMSLRPLADGDDASGLSASSLASLSIAIGLSSALVMVISWASVGGLDRRHSRAKSEPGAGWRRLGKALRAQHLQRTIALGALASLGLPLFAKSLLYVAANLLSGVGDASGMLTAMVVGQLAGIALWIGLASRKSSTTLLTYAYGLAALGLASAILFLALAPALVLVSCFVVGIGAAGAYSLIWAIVADAADRVRAETGIGASGAIFALAILAQKAAMGLGAMILGTGLDLAGYEAGGRSQAIGLAIVGCGLALPCALALACAWLCHVLGRSNRA